MGAKETKNDVLALYDISMVKPIQDSPEIAALKSFKKSFSNNISVTLNQLIMMSNLILLGHTFFKNQINYDLLMLYQIVVFILGLFGKIFIIGLLKYLFEDKEENDIYKLYIRMKTILVIIIPIVFIPLVIISYFLIDLLLRHVLKINDHNILKELYLNFFIFIPVIYFFELLFLLNNQFLHHLKCYKSVFFYALFFMIAHISLSCILLYILEIGIIGLTISYGFNSFFFYYLSCRTIKKYGNYTEQNYFFYLIPYNKNFDGELINTFKRNSLISIINYGDIITFLVLFAASVFIDKKEFFINIIYINFYELIFSINKGFYFNLKTYIMETMEDSENRQKYVASFVFYYMIMELAIFLVLIIFRNILLNIYLMEIKEYLFELSGSVLRILFPVSLLLSSVRFILNGIVRGMSVAMHPLKKIFYLLCYMLLCWILCFEYKCRIFGLWISLIAFDLLLLIESIHKAYSIFPRFFHNMQ